MQRPTQHPGQFGPLPGIGLNPPLLRHPGPHPSLPHVLQQQRPSHLQPGGPIGVRPYGPSPQQEVAAQQQVLMLQIGSVAQIFNKSQDSNITYEEYHKKQLENAGYLDAIEACRYREECMLNLEEAVTQSCLPRLFGLQEVDRSLSVKLFPPRPKPKNEGSTEGESPPETENRFPYPSILPFKWLDDGGPSGETQSSGGEEDTTTNLEECIENFVLTCNNPMLSLGDPKGRQLRCLREVPAGGFVVTPSSINFLTEVTHKILRALLTKCMEVVGESPYDDLVDEYCVREAVRRLGDAKSH